MHPWPDCSGASVPAGTSGVRHHAVTTRVPERVRRPARHPVPMDPTTTLGTALVQQAYRAFAEQEARGVSPVYEEWALGVGDDDRRRGPAG